ncbi:hypothetical protein T07_12843 [Trichinella nelsoni]|uniref:Uncharacterized protein n=1 Tax=Trichinella nelsoni TaxID=6336 RepID=A0A0V0SFZ2_9BILA|nr:hypothetical protein T07_12843 [Trichinella nelsoni]
MTTTGKVLSVLLTLDVRSSRGEAWQSLLMCLPYVQHALRSVFYRRGRCWEAAGMFVISSSFNCRTTSASSATSFCVITVATAASVTSTDGCRSSWSATAFTEETLNLSVVSSLQ